MLRTVAFAPFLLLTLVAAPAGAVDCLQEVDSISVEFDLPTTQAMTGTQTGNAYYIPPPPPDAPRALPPETMTPPGRPGAPRATGGGSLQGAAPLPGHDRISASQRKELQSLLQQARSVEALGNETQCFDLLHQAQAITKKKSG
jgi:hypothetical protein